MSYQRADFEALRCTGYGVGVHWTTASVPAAGEPLAYPDAVEAFDVDAFVDSVRDMGAGHVLLTATHSRHQICGPNPEIDSVLPGRTCRRDLLKELGEALAAHGIRFIVYYNSGVHAGDPEWRAACGAGAPDPSGFFSNWCRILSWMGRHYGLLIDALWIDGGYELEKLGNTPWADMTAALKAGNPDRLVCYNPGIERHFLYTPFQDYWAGEVCRLNFIPRGDLTPAGLPWYAFVSWHGDSRKPTCGYWVMNEENRALDWVSPQPEAAVALLKGFHRVGGAVTFNVFCYQDGSIYGPDLDTMRGVRRLMGR